MAEAATLSSSEAVRDRASTEDAPEREPAREPEVKPEAPRSAFGDVSERLRSTMDEYRGARERISAGQRDYATELAPAIQAARQSIQSRANLPPPPAAPQLKEPPSRKLTDFLAPVQGEAPEQSVSKMMQALGQLAMGLGVGGKKDARAALAAWSGALKGWQEGDKERADRSFKDWQANTDKALTQWKVDRTAFEDIIKNAEMSMEDKFRLINLLKLDREMKAAPDVTDADTLNQLMGHLEKQASIAATVENTKATLQQSFELKQQQLAFQDRWKQFEADNRFQLEMLRQENRFDKPHHGLYWDKAGGVMRELSEREWMENNRAQRDGRPGPYTPLTDPGTPNLLRRIALAPPILDRLDVLIDRITKAAPGENLTQGLINKLKRRAGIGESIQEFVNLNVDGLIELTGSLSGGQPRIAILRILKEDALPTDSMTTAVAHKAVSTMRTTINNRIVDITQDPEAMTKLSQHFKPYQDSPTQAGAIPKELPDPATKKGMVATDTQTGQRYVSDGTQWSPVR